MYFSLFFSYSNPQSIIATRRYVCPVPSHTRHPPFSTSSKSMQGVRVWGHSKFRWTALRLGGMSSLVPRVCYTMGHSKGPEGWLLYRRGIFKNQKSRNCPRFSSFLVWYTECLEGPSLCFSRFLAWEARPHDGYCDFHLHFVLSVVGI